MYVLYFAILGYHRASSKAVNVIGVGQPVLPLFSHKYEILQMTRDISTLLQGTLVPVFCETSWRGALARLHKFSGHYKYLDQIHNLPASV